MARSPEAEVARQARRLASTAPLVGPWLRRSARKALAGLQDAEAVDALCQAWAERREPELGALIAGHGYVARKPPAVRVLSALRARRLSAAADSAVLLPHLAAALQDPELGAAAREAVLAARAPAQVEALCDLATSGRHPELVGVLREAGAAPAGLARRAAFFVLTDQLEHYFDLDYDFQHLAAAYDAAGPAVQRALDEVVRRSGDTRLLGLYARLRGRQRAVRKVAAQLSEREAAITLDVYRRRGLWADIFRLLPHLPLVSAVTALDHLQQAGWRPEEAAAARALDALLLARARIRGAPRVAEAEAVPGAVLRRWLDEGRAQAAGAALPGLIKELQEAPPPAAVRALAALAERDALGPPLVQLARQHPHWLVRLAFLLLGESHASIAFGALPFGEGGGSHWLERQTPALVDAMVYRRRPERLTPPQLEALEQALGSAREEGGLRRAYGHLLAVFGRQNLARSIEAEAGVRVDLDVSDVEVEG